MPIITNGSRGEQVLHGKKRRGFHYYGKPLLFDCKSRSKGWNHWGWGLRKGKDGEGTASLKKMVGFIGTSMFYKEL